MERIVRSTKEEVSRLPFAGLGHDMAPVREKAARMCLVSVRRKDVVVVAAGVALVGDLPVTAGYDLLLAISRETCGP